MSSRVAVSIYLRLSGDRAQLLPLVAAVPRFVYILLRTRARARGLSDHPQSAAGVAYLGVGAVIYLRANGWR